MLQICEEILKKFQIWNLKIPRKPTFRKFEIKNKYNIDLTAKRSDFYSTMVKFGNYELFHQWKELFLKIFTFWGAFIHTHTWVRMHNAFSPIRLPFPKCILNITGINLIWKPWSLEKIATFYSFSKNRFKNKTFLGIFHLILRKNFANSYQNQSD